MTRLARRLLLNYAAAALHTLLYALPLAAALTGCL